MRADPLSAADDSVKLRSSDQVFQTVCKKAFIWFLNPHFLSLRPFLASVVELRRGKETRMHQ